jgi:hypothetical protein
MNLKRNRSEMLILIEGPSNSPGGDNHSYLVRQLSLF